MRRVLTSMIAIVFIALASISAQEPADDFKVKVGGIVWYQYYYDTYQSVETRDGLLLLYPNPKADINKAGKLGSSAFFSRANVKFSGSSAFGAKASGMIEGDFVATSQTIVGQFRLRHAFVKLDWGKANLLMGQYWHPIICTDIIPSADQIANIPFFPLMRTPQVKFTYNISSNLSIRAAMAVHSYHKTVGPADIQRNSGLPEFVGKVKYKTDNIVVGLNGGVNTIKPSIYDKLGKVSSSVLASPYIGGFAKTSVGPVTIKGQLIYGKNISHFTTIGGYAISDTTGDDYTYSGVKTLTTWWDIHTNGKKIQGGLFIGYAQLMGASDDVVPNSFVGRGGALSNTWRVAPRIDFFSGKMKIGCEVGFSGATYATTWDNQLVPQETGDLSVNTRFLANIMYKF